MLDGGGMLVSASAYIPEETPLRVVRDADDETVSVRFGPDEQLSVELDDAVVTVLIQALQSARP